MAKAPTPAKGKQTPKFSDLLDTPADAIERPKPLPIGPYVCKVAGQPPRQDVSSKKQTPFVEFTLKPIAPYEAEGEVQVDAEQLAEVGGLENKTIKATFYLTPEAMYRFKDFAEHCGVDVSKGTPRSWIEEIPNSDVIAFIRHEYGDDGTVYGRLGRTAPAE